MNESEQNGMVEQLERDNALMREAMNGLRSWFQMRIDVVDAENERLKATMRKMIKGADFSI